MHFVLSSAASSVVSCKVSCDIFLISPFTGLPMAVPSITSCLFPVILLSSCLLTASSVSSMFHRMLLPNQKPISSPSTPVATTAYICMFLPSFFHNKTLTSYSVSFSGKHASFSFIKSKSIAATIPAAMQNRFRDAASADVVKLPQGTVITVAAPTIPRIP